MTSNIVRQTSAHAIATTIGETEICEVQSLVQAAVHMNEQLEDGSSMTSQDRCKLQAQMACLQRIDALLMAPANTTKADVAAGPASTNAQINAGLFEEIASLAAELDRQCYLHNDVDELSDVEAVQLHVNSLRRSILQIGMMADQGAERNAGTPVKGRVEEWLHAQLVRNV